MHYVLATTALLEEDAAADDAADGEARGEGGHHQLRLDVAQPLGEAGELQRRGAQHGAEDAVGRAVVPHAVVAAEGRAEQQQPLLDE